MVRPIWTYDRRRRTRISATALIALDVCGIDPRVRVRNVGMGGAVVVLTRPLTPGTTPDLVLRVADRRWSLRGRVVHCRATLRLDAARRPLYVAGMAFDTLPADAVAALDTVVRLAGGHQQCC